MGVCIIAIDDEATIGNFHVNFAGLRTLEDLLVEPGCDVSSSADFDNGDIVAVTTASWPTENPPLRPALLSAAKDDTLAFNDETTALV